MAESPPCPTWRFHDQQFLVKTKQRVPIQNKGRHLPRRGPQLTLVPQPTSIKASGLGNQTTPAQAGPEKPGCNKSRSSAYKVDTSTAWAMGNPIIVIVVILNLLLIVTARMKLIERGHLQCPLRPFYKATHALPKASQLVSHTCKRQQDLLHTISSYDVYLQR